ncbi:MAG: LemA family protein [Patescibacteria group bacterium]
MEIIGKINDFAGGIGDFFKSINLLLTLLWTVLGALGSFVGWFVFTYNSLVQKRRRTDEEWANIAAAIKRRADLIPNLVETVKGYAGHERATLENVTRARSAVMDATGPAEQMKAENMLTGALKSLFAVAESYPDLKANQNFSEMQRELAESENRVYEARKIYNAAVQELNVKIESIPSNFVAKVFRFKKAEFFEAEAAAIAVPKVSF